MLKTKTSKNLILLLALASLGLFMVLFALGSEYKAGSTSTDPSNQSGNLKISGVGLNNKQGNGSESA